MEPLSIRTWTETHALRLGQSAFLLTSQSGLTVAIDPFRPDPRWQAADLVLITHDHPDHFNAAVVRSLLKPGTRVVVPASVKASGGDQGLATDTVTPGASLTAGPFTLTAVRAYNLKAKFHPRERDWVGYLFTLDGLAIYHAGDTDLIPEMEGLRVDLALLPAGGVFTMNPAAAARAAALVKAAVAVPMHYGMIPFSGGAGKAFARAHAGQTVLL